MATKGVVYLLDWVVYLPERVESRYSALCEGFVYLLDWVVRLPERVNADNTTPSEGVVYLLRAGEAKRVNLPPVAYSPLD